MNKPRRRKLLLYRSGMSNYVPPTIEQLYVRDLKKYLALRLELFGPFEQFRWN